VRRVVEFVLSVRWLSAVGGLKGGSADSGDGQYLLGDVTGAGGLDVALNPGFAVRVTACAEAGIRSEEGLDGSHGTCASTLIAVWLPSGAAVISRVGAGRAPVAAGRVKLSCAFAGPFPEEVPLPDHVNRLGRCSFSHVSTSLGDPLACQ